jgi:hypothetical protein
MREAPLLRMLFNPMMLAHSALVTQLEFYDVQILKLANGDKTTRRLMTVPGVGRPATALAAARSMTRTASRLPAMSGPTLD